MECEGTKRQNVRPVLKSSVESTEAAASEHTFCGTYNDPDNGKIVFQGKAGSREDPYVSGVKLQRMAARIDFQFDPVKNVSGSAPYSSFD